MAKRIRNIKEEERTISVIFPELNETKKTSDAYIFILLLPSLKYTTSDEIIKDKCLKKNKLFYLLRLSLISKAI